MFDIEKIRNDFPMIKQTMQNHPLIYFDNGATTLKPNQVIDAEMEYYKSYTANAHRGDYDIAYKVDTEYESARKKIAKFINAGDNEVVFTSGTSMGINMIAHGLAYSYLHEGDIILISEAEHASNVLPWFKAAEIAKAKIEYIPLDEKGRVTLENLKKVITPRCKVVALAHISNVLGYEIDVINFSKIIHENGGLFVLDGAQSVPHKKVDVKLLDVDFLVFSGHKMLGPTGIGAMYGKYDLLLKLDPLMTGGGMNTTFDMCGHIGYQYPPLKFEAGTQNIAGAIGFGAAIDYLNNIGIDIIEKREAELKEYAINKMKDLDNIIIYNSDSTSSIITFNFKDVFAQDGATLLNSKGIAVRSGLHCAKILVDFLKTDATIRASLYFYNTKKEIDYFVEQLKKGGDFLDAYFI